MKIISIKQFKNLKDKTVFLRVDFNVPMKNGKVLDELKIRESLEDIHYLLDHNCKVIIATHLGRPEGRAVKEYSTKPLATLLSRVLNLSVKFLDATGAKNLVAAKSLIEKIKPGNVIFLENLRFNKEEQKNDDKFAQGLASLADVYVNDAFAVSHRADASVAVITKYLPTYAGLLLEKEIINLNKILKPKKPFVAVMGGAKIETKIALLKNLSKNASQILVGGALANNFLAAKKVNIGKSLTDKNSIKIAKSLLKNKKIILPVDFITCLNLKTDKKLNKNNIIRIRKFDQIGKDETVVDIGPETIGLFAKYLKKAKTIVWNGPLGLFEIPNFKQGTVIIARLIASRSSGMAYGVVGGGETVEALDMTKMGEYIDWVSTGGGAMLSYLGGEKMPGLKKIVK